MTPLIPWFEVPAITVPGTDFKLHGFGFLVAMGFLFGGKAAMGRARRLGLDPDVINRLITWLVVGTFIGGHVGYGLMYKPDEYLADPKQFLYLWQGLSSFGGFVVCVPLSIWFFYKEKVDVWKYLDCLAYGMAIGWFFGRMGCFVAHDHPGSPTNFYLGVWCRPEPGHMIDLPDWLVLDDNPNANRPFSHCVDDPSVHAVHDMGLYEALWSLSMFGLFQLMDRRAWKPGVMVLLLGTLYAPARFAMDFLRPVSSDPRYASLTPAQWLAAVLFVVCAFAVYRRMQAPAEPVKPAPRGA